MKSNPLVTEMNGPPPDTEAPAPTRSRQSLMLEILARGAAQVATGSVIGHEDVFAALEAEDRLFA